MTDLYGKKPIDVITNDKITSMLAKQKKHTLTKNKSLKIEKITQNKLLLKSSTVFKGIHVPTRPPRVTGYIYKIGKFFGGKNQRFFELNPIEGMLIKYMHKNDYPKKPKEIYCISDITKLVRLPHTEHQNFHFFEVS
jgi:hypothetical protein